MTDRPPLLGRILLRLCRLGERRGDVRADLQELFERRVATDGARQARRRFVSDVLSLLAPSPRSVTSGLRADLRDATRALWRTPLQTASVFLCLVLGTTLTVAMFTIVNTMMAGDLPGIADRGRLFRVASVSAASGEHRRLSVGPYQALPRSLPGVAGMAVQIPKAGSSASVNGVPTQVRAQIINGGYFQTLGTQPAAGRLLLPSDDLPSAPPVIVLGHELWQRAYGGAAEAIGAPIAMGPVVYTIVGVAPRGFGGLMALSPGRLASGPTDAADLWMPEVHAAWGRDSEILNGCDNCTGPTVAVRLSENVTPDDLAPHLAAAATAYDADLQRRGVTTPTRMPGGTTQEVRILRFGGYALEPFRLVQEGTDGLELAGGISLLMAVPIIVLGIACANVAGVQLARALRRTHEFATRVAVGASRFQLMRLIVLESAIVALAAGVTAWFITAQSLRWTAGLLPVEMAADLRVFVFALLTPVVVTLLAGLLPSWRATGFRVLDGLQQGAGAGGSARVSRLRRLVLVGQIALSVALLGISLHLARGVALAPAQFAPLQTDVLVADVRTYDLGLTPEQLADLRVQVDRALREAPGVTHVAFGAELLPVPSQRTAGPLGYREYVTPEWFAAIGQPLRAGRIPTAPDATALVINETLAKHYGGSVDAVGQTIPIQSGQREDRVEVVGVIADGYERIARPMSMAYTVVAANDASSTISTIYIKGPGAAAARRRVLDALEDVHPQLAPHRIGTVEALVNAQLQPARVVITTLGTMSVAALLLAAVGLFGAISQSASSRVREFGVRLALGATPVDVGRIVLRETTWVTGAGLVLGLGAATLCAFVMRAAMYDTASPYDLIPPAVVIAAVVLIAFLAALTPARRVMAIDPVKTLRGE
jgi:predicted permease